MARTTRPAINAAKPKSQVRREGTRRGAVSLPARLSGTMKAGLIKDYVRAASYNFVSRRNITGIGVAHKSVDGVKTDEIAIRFTVKRKVAPEALDGIRSELLPKFIRLESMMVPTDVVERRYWPSSDMLTPKQKALRKQRMPTIQPGASISNEAMFTAGTLGAFMRDAQTGEPVLLSNWHILDGDYAAIDSDIVQPGTLDNNQTSQNIVGRLLRSYIGPVGDFAVCSIANRAFNPVILDLGVSVTGIGDPRPGDRVVKSSRTTGVTYGIVGAPQVSVRMKYAKGRRAIVGGFEIEPDPANPRRFDRIADRGDSGAAWMACDANGQPTSTMLGLQFAVGGTTTPDRAVACFAKSVVTQLGLRPL